MYQATTAAIQAIIENHALCRNCIASKTAMTPDAVDRAIAALARAIKIDRYASGMCLDCGREGLVFAVDRPPRR